MSLYRTIQSHIKDFQYKLYTTLPATVTKYDPVECTVDVQPAITEIDIDGLIRVLPFLERVPLMFSTSKDSSITFPVKVGDYVLLHFCQSEIDNLLVQTKTDQKEFVDPRSPRKHTINDCFATIGIRVYEDSPVKRPDTLDMYFKDSRLTIEDNGNITLQLTKTDGNQDNPQVVHTQTLEMLNDGTTKIEFVKDNIISNVILESNGNVSVKTNSKFSVTNDNIELITLLSDLIDTLANTTVNTIYGPTILNSKPQLQNLKSQIDTMKV